MMPLRLLHFIMMTSPSIKMHHYDPPFISPRLYLISYVELRNRLPRLPNPILTTRLTLHTDRADVVLFPYRIPGNALAFPNLS